MGTSTTNLKLYKPPWSNTAGEVTLFATGLDNIEARHSKEVFYGDPNYTTLALIAAATNTVIHIPPGSNITVAADTEFGVGSTVIMHPNSKFTITGTGTVLYIPDCRCRGVGPFFDIAATCTVNFGKHFEAGRVSVFTGAGVADRGTMASTWTVWASDTAAWLNPPVKWGLGPELVADRTFATWTMQTNWSNPVSGTLRAAAATSAQGAYVTPTTPRMNQYFLKFHVSAYTSGSFKAQIQNTYTSNIVGTGWYAQYLTTSPASAGNKLGFVGIASHDFTGDIDFVSARQVISTNVNKIYPEWFGAVPDGLTDCTAALQAAIHCAASGNPPAATTALYLLRLPHIVKLASGCYVISSTLTMKPRACIIGEGCSTVIQVGTPGTWAFTGSKAISVTENYNIGNNKEVIFGDFTVDATYTVPTEARPFYVFYVQCAFDHSQIDKIAINGAIIYSGHYDTPADWETVGFYFGPTGGSYHSMHLNNCNLTNCNSWTTGSIYIAADSAAAQNLDIGNNMVTSPGGLPMNVNCVYSHIYNNLINTYPIWGLCIKKRLHTSLYKQVTKAVYNGTSGFTELSGFTMGTGLVNTGTAHESVFITGGTGDWAAINGLWPIKTGSSATKICIPVNSTGFSAYDPGTGIYAEVCGGFLPRWIVGSYNNFTSNYIDGGDYTVNALTGRNVNSLTALGTIHGGFNLGFEPEAVMDLCMSAGAFVNYAGTYVSSTTLTFSDGVSRVAYCGVNYPIAIYQVGADGHIYGYFKTTIVSCTYGAGTNTLVLSEGCLISGATITVYPMTARNWNFTEGLNTVYMGDTVAQQLQVGSSTLCAGSTIQHAAVIPFTCGTPLTIAAGASATISIPVTGAMTGYGAKYSVFITPPTTIPAYIIVNASINTAADTITVNLKNTDGATTWTYSSTVWNAFIVRALA